MINEHYTPEAVIQMCIRDSTYAFENITRAGDHIVAAKTIYGGSYNLLAHTLPSYGITTTFVDPSDLSNFEKAIQDNTKAVFIETLGNPNSNIIDIEAVSEIAHRHKIPLIIDNTFGTPYLIRPIEHGADIVVHSATKDVYKRQVKRSPALS